jgi:hypothetical protein
MPRLSPVTPPGETFTIFRTISPKAIVARERKWNLSFEAGYGEA